MCWQWDRGAGTGTHTKVTVSKKEPGDASGGGEGRWLEGAGPACPLQKCTSPKRTSVMAVVASLSLLVAVTVYLSES